MATLGERLKFARERIQPELSQSELAKRVGVKPQSIQAIEIGRVRSTKFAIAMARELGVSAEWLAHETGEAPEGWPPLSLEHGQQIVTEAPKESSIFGDASGQPQPPVYHIDAQMLGWSGDLPPKGSVPLLQAARGGMDQEMFVEDGPIDYIPLPPCLLNVPKGYAMLVVGDSMHPVYRPGTVIYVNPNLRPAVGDGVVIWKKNKSILVKALARRRPHVYTLHEYQPKERDFEVPRSDVAEIHVIVGTDSTRGRL